MPKPMNPKSHPEIIRMFREAVNIQLELYRKIRELEKVVQDTRGDEDEIYGLDDLVGTVGVGVDEDPNDIKDEEIIKWIEELTY